MMQMQHQGQGPPPQQAGQPGHYNPAQQIAAMNEAVWLQIGMFRLNGSALNDFC